MFRRCFLLTVALFLLASAFAQLPSPEQFLGYRIGTRFTPHWKVVNYVRAAAAAAPDRVKVEQYGQTVEGRPLLAVFISSAANIANLESIRAANLRLANEPRTAAAPSAPVIVWLSFNVHGNESSSTEASLLTIHALADPTNSRTQAWLQNTVVVVDPCLNPDGRDRYVNWFNTMVGSEYDPAISAREHDEPWPGGRINHYNFDLNRDWAWQTQVESQARVALYNRWLPEVHADFHEQSINNPYYFAPAAQPYHEVITPWQREFQTTIGRNHAKYFDAHGWLYFTKEEFDLTYPAYGDTYPLYNGAIGMTYEQAGNSHAGLGVLTASGDTLTLVDRAEHHFTTALSTVEVASANAARLLTEFRKFYSDAVTTGVGSYKSYIIKYSAADASRIQQLLTLLDRNGIRYGRGRAASLHGFSYASGREENFAVAGEDLVISSLQPKSAMVKVLFEPSTVLVDTLAYDITAWSLPYAYGLKAYASTQTLEPAGTFALPAISAIGGGEPYAYVIRWNGMPAVQLVSQLLQQGIRLRYNERPFEAGGQSFERGAVLVLRTNNRYVAGLWDTVRAVAARYTVPLVQVNSGFVDKGYDFGSVKVHPLRVPRVVLLTGDGVSASAAGEVWYYFDVMLHYPLRLVNARSAMNMNWNDVDVVIMPDGAYRFLNDKTQTDQFHSWIRNGGHVIALEGAVDQLARLDWTIKAHHEDSSDSHEPYEALKHYEDRDRDFIPKSLPGSIFRVELDNTHPLAFGYPGYYYTLKQDDHVYDFIREDGWNVGVLKKDRQVAGFVGSRLRNRLQDGLLFGVQDIGRGTIIYLADDVLFRSFWKNGELMFANAVFLVGE